MLRLALGRDLGDDRDDLRRADVESDDQVLRFLHHPFTIVLSSSSSRYAAGLARRPFPESRHARREAVAVAQIDVVDPRAGSQQRAHGALVGSDEAREPLGRLVAAELDLERSGLPGRAELPAAARRKRHFLDRKRSGARAVRSIRDSARPRPPRARRGRRIAAARRRSRRRRPRPRRRRDRCRSSAPNGTCSSIVTSSRCGHWRRNATRRTHGTRASAVARAIEVHREERPGELVADHRFEMRRTRAHERRRDDDLAELEHRLPQRATRARPSASAHVAISARPRGDGVQLSRVIPHARPAGSRRTGRRTRSRLPSPPSAPASGRSCPATCSLRGTDTSRRRAG